MKPAPTARVLAELEGPIVLRDYFVAIRIRAQVDTAKASSTSKRTFIPPLQPKDLSWGKTPFLVREMPYLLSEEATGIDAGSRQHQPEFPSAPHVNNP
jgi:hypothetical protein